MGRLRALHSHALATVQDEGRQGYLRYGLPASGAMDLDSLNAVNQVLGNQVGSPALEFALQSVAFEAERNTHVACAGAIRSVHLNGALLETFSCSLKPGDQLEVTPSPQGGFAYLGVLGQWELEPVLGSYSTCLPGQIGGISGRSLQFGDVLETKTDAEPIHDPDGSTLPEVPAVIRLLRGPEYWSLKKDFTLHDYRITPESDRMGFRLQGTAIQSSILEIPSAAVFPGVVQVPGDGQPIVLMRDCGTTGGYPRVACLVTEDINRLAQWPWDRPVRFKWVEL